MAKRKKRAASRRRTRRAKRVCLTMTQLKNLFKCAKKGTCVLRKGKVVKTRKRKRARRK